MNLNIWVLKYRRRKRYWPLLNFPYILQNKEKEHILDQEPIKYNSPFLLNNSNRGTLTHNSLSPDFYKVYQSVRWKGWLFRALSTNILINLVGKNHQRNFCVSVFQFYITLFPLLSPGWVSPLFHCVSVSACRSTVFFWLYCITTVITPFIRRSPGGVLPYISHIGKCRPIGWGFCACKNGYTLAHFGLESGMVSRELRSVWTYLSFQSQMSKKEREICEFEVDWIKFLFAL